MSGIVKAKRPAVKAKQVGTATTPKVVAARKKAPAGKEAVAGAKAARTPKGPVPTSTDEIPFQELSRDAVSGFLYAALLPEETLALVKRLGLGRPGFRPEGLGEVERCDLLADELRSHPPSRPALMEVLRGGLKEPAFATSALDPAAADELLEVAASDHGLAIALWRLLADPQAAVRQRAGAALERLAADWYGPGPGDGERPAPAPGRGGAGGAREDGAVLVQALEEKLARAEARAEEQRQRGDAQREKLQLQLKEARAEAARAVDEAARVRQGADLARAAQGRAEAALTAARASDAAGEAVRLRGALREAEVRLHAVEVRAARASEREGALTAALLAAEAQATYATTSEPSPSPRAGQPDDPEETPASWLLPVFTPEFYDSLAGWDRRIQRAALKQAFLLSQDYRHPSLRALPLEGLPGYYRVRVATDVRLIYRRGDRQDSVEVCSLIDREDLDRYVRQAKTR